MYLSKGCTKEAKNTLFIISDKLILFSPVDRRCAMITNPNQNSNYKVLI